MRTKTWRLSLLIAVGGAVGGAVGASAHALPHPEDKIDPSKRAEVSTSDAIRPSARPTDSDGVVNARIIRMSELPIRRAHVNGDGKTFPMVESRPKVVINRKTVRTPEVKKIESIRAARDMPASIPRIRRERFQKMISEYERGRVPADEFLHASIEVGGQTLDLGEINKYANPSRALEGQGIPVKKAGTGPAPESSAATVPIGSDRR